VLRSYKKPPPSIVIELNTENLCQLSNWREAPFNKWSFHNVDQLISCESIASSRSSTNFTANAINMNSLRLTDSDDSSCGLNAWLTNSNTDACILLHDGKIAHEWYATDYDNKKPHIIFSVSKSLTAILSGILNDKGLLDFTKPVTDYIPELVRSGYSDCLVSHILDMTVALRFEESYLDTTGQFAKYRQSTGWNPVGSGATMYLKEFLCQLQRGDGEHGAVFNYMSPNSDVLGWLVERATNLSLADALSKFLFQPIEATGSSYITVDAEGTPRAAGGICSTAQDLVKIGELMRNRGRSGTKQVVSESWVNDTLNNGSFEAWNKGSFSQMIAGGRYHNKWYQCRNPSRAFCAIGIHGQWIYVDPEHKTTIVKLSCQPEPFNESIELTMLQGFDRIAKYLDES
jgi:CubicO group peptidase (beta-lactamase class C family)